MRDFRDAKTMAHSIRAALAANGLKITVSQSLELIAKAFGTADWNTLSAAITAEPSGPRQGFSPAPPVSAETLRPPERVGFSSDMTSTLHRAVTHAKQRSHEYATLEHLLLALTDDNEASAVMRGCNVDLHSLQKNLGDYLDSEPKQASDEARPTAGFQRVIQRAVVHVQASGRQSVTGAQVLVAIFSEQESRAAHLLDEHAMTRLDAVNFMRSGDAAA